MYRTYADHTMVPADSYINNLVPAKEVRNVEVAWSSVECGAVA